ncbi:MULTISPECIES: hypothetical protein [unclassified Prevotella]|uniref:hypothetical protein n=1 Tax=unclassified Prevotella TaxID=2638335 RepID=UPI000514831A|nr:MULTISPECIES: hypothetical protein [unclassified Prevotella]KGI59515.1 hypothetical protein HMPREF0671_11265 [Prevotella sp. S7 MS 2]
MRRTCNILLGLFWGSIVLSLLMVVLFESDLLLPGDWTTDKSAEFLWAVVMELLTICVIPLALRLFHFTKVEKQIISSSSETSGAYRRLAILRLLLLMIPLVANTFLYYMFMNVAFGYMGIILLLSACFIYPSLSRCLSETQEV